MDDIYPAFEKAHPYAQMLMIEDWFYSFVDDMAPFGSDDAADTFVDFYEWRQTHKNISPKVFVSELFQEWGYSQINLERADYKNIKSCLEQKKGGYIHLFGMDTAIIATAFGQLYMEGKIDPDIRSFAETAVKRELLPQILNFWEELKFLREERLNALLIILNACKNDL